MTVYADIFFIINFIIDYIILTLSCGKCRSFTLNRAAAAALGGLYACLSLYDLPKLTFIPLSRGFVLFLMCGISMFPVTPGNVLSAFVKAFCLSMLLSGTILSVMSLLSISYGSPLPDILLAGAVFAAYICYKSLEKSLTHTTKSSHMTIVYNGKTVTLDGKCDTGNFLKSSDGLPVIVADLDSIKCLFPKITSPQQLSEFAAPCDFRIIPYKTIADNGILYGFVPDSLIDAGNKKLNAVIAIAPIKLEAPLLFSPELL